MIRYQVRIGLLQAGHYGAPQARVRFFLVAAQSSHPLPSLPQPTHDFEVKDALTFKLPSGQRELVPVRTERGIAPHKAVSIDDAISDLPRFDWYVIFHCLCLARVSCFSGNLPKMHVIAGKATVEFEETL